MKKRWIAISLSAAMVMGLMTGCGGSDSSGSSGSSDSDASAGDGDSTGAAEVNFDEEPYEATFMYWAANDARDLESVQEAFNELTMRDLNMKVTLQPITLGTYTQQIQMVLSSDDDLDIFPYFASNMGSYIDADYIVDMSEYMDTYGQDLIDIIGEDDIACGTIDGFLGGVPTMHERLNTDVFVLRTDILEETGYTADDIQTASDLTKVFAKVKELYPDMVVCGGAYNNTLPVMMTNAVTDPLGGGTFGVLMDYGQTTTVTNWFESDQFIEACKLMREWFEAGYLSADLATCSDSGESLMRAGNLFSFASQGKPNTKAEKDSMTGYDTTIVQVLDGGLYTTVTNACLYGISSNSKDPEKAMMLLNWIYKTKEANDLINWGIEGSDYVVTDDGTIDYPEGVTAESVGYHQDFGWALPNQYNSYVWTGNVADIWDQYQEARDNAQMSKAYGFFFDTTPVLNELSALNSIYEEYVYTIASGSVETESAIAEFNEKMYAAGLQDVIDAKQEALDAWLAEQ